MRHSGCIGLCALSMVLAGCISVAEINRANYAMDAAWQKDVTALLAKDGTRYYSVSRADAFAAMNATLVTLGMIVDRHDEGAGVLAASSIAPRPLTDEEWKMVGDRDVPLMREVVSKEIGPMSASLFVLQPDQYKLAFVAAVDGSTRSAKVGMTARLQRINRGNPAIYWPVFPPPTAARVGLAKVWSTFEEELTRRRLPSKKIDALEPVRPERSS